MCLCHFAAGMVVSWRVGAILHQVWSSVGLCFVSFCVGYGFQLACVCAILHRLRSSVGVCLGHFASGTVIKWRVCAFLHQVWSSVGVLVAFCIRYVVSWRVSVPFCIKYGRQLVCVSAILHQVRSLVGVFVAFCIR